MLWNCQVVPDPRFGHDNMASDLTANFPAQLLEGSDSLFTRDVRQFSHSCSHLYRMHNCIGDGAPVVVKAGGKLVTISGNPAI